MQKKKLKKAIAVLLAYDWIPPEKMIFHLSLITIYANRQEEYSAALSPVELEDVQRTVERLMFFLNAISLPKKEQP